MMTKPQAQQHAKAMQELHGEEWLVFRTPDNAPCNQYPANIYNSGRFATCPHYDRAEYEAEGADFTA